jgi:hypothetical protein
MTKEEIQAARLERKRRQAERRTRTELWNDQKTRHTTVLVDNEGNKRTVPSFSVTLSYKEVRAKAYRSLAEGDTETAVLLNELLKVRRRMEKAGPLLKAVRRLEGAQVRFEAAVANACRVKLSPKVKGELRKERREKRSERDAKALATLNSTLSGEGE